MNLGQTPGQAKSFVQQLTLAWERCELSESDRAMLDYSVKLTKCPQSIGQADIDRLRETGFDDRGIHDICAITSYFAFVNRIADGLGVELES